MISPTGVLSHSRTTSTLIPSNTKANSTAAASPWPKLRPPPILSDLPFKNVELQLLPSSNSLPLQASTQKLIGDGTLWVQPSSSTTLSSSSEDGTDTHLDLSIGRRDSTLIRRKETSDEHRFHKEDNLNLEAIIKERHKIKMEVEMAENEFSKAKRFRQQAQSELKKAILMREHAMKQIKNLILQVTCHSCQQHLRYESLVMGSDHDKSLDLFLVGNNGAEVKE